MKVLIVDDVELNRDMLVDALCDEYEILTASSGEQALELLEVHREEIDLVLLDLVMPGMDGFSVMTAMRERNWLKDTPVIVITGEHSRQIEKQSLDNGASDFIRKPLDNYVVRQRVKNTAELFCYKRSLEKQVERQTAVLKRQARKIEQNNEKIIDVLGTVVEYRNLESGEHIKRVKEFTRILAGSVREHCPEYGLTEAMVELISAASPLHDIGKIIIPDHVLLKPGKLTKEEFDLMKTHTSGGGEILQHIEGAWDGEYGRVCYEICRWHHERFDGRGYPDGLKGDEIPISAQIVSVADVYDALVSKRVYKDAFSLEEAFRMIIAGQCGTFSPKLMEAFQAVRDQFEVLALRYA